MNNLMTPTAHTKKHHRFDPAEIVALAALSAVGAVLHNPRLANLDIPPAMRADVTFDGCAGIGQITGIEIFGPYDRPLEPHETGRLLEVSLPAANGDKMPIGKLLNGALLSLPLDLADDDDVEAKTNVGPTINRGGGKRDLCVYDAPA